jgi:hypothetical protein
VSAPIPLIVLTNGRRDCISQTVPSITKHLTGYGDTVIVDDSGNREYRAWLATEFPDALLTAVGPEPAGYWRAMRTVWSIARGSGADAVWLAEDDFTLLDDLDVACLDRVLDEHPYLTQIALRRQPWFGNEIAYGGMLEALEAQGLMFAETSDGKHHWIEHRACFTGNPCLIPQRTFAHDWPEGEWSESRFGRLLFADPLARGAYWGRRDDPPRVEHIGHERVGTDY